MKATTKMLWLFIIIILGSALLFVFLDDDDTKGNSLNTPQFHQTGFC